jgi:hypothetical protein
MGSVDWKLSAGHSISSTFEIASMRCALPLRRTATIHAKMALPVSCFVARRSAPGQAAVLRRAGTDDAAVALSVQLTQKPVGRCVWWTAFFGGLVTGTPQWRKRQRRCHHDGQRVGSQFSSILICRTGTEFSQVFRTKEFRT